ncbi:SDR family NAD(P)-dependent oxidoreductase [Gulosibacter chungangensis]|uniref:SDR family NAD(P)-dependent oxidoreductase n=1 Tax=Gulosibacter chungangensis TaxID=979746 RepID=A0A7J5BF30_9MICO|nr:SDR family NAD(P)-dependent oxidoreductase [Gulosibacter chungangensis]
MENPLAPASLTGKRVLVTGSSRGVGADTIRYFAKAGASVVVNYRNKEARALKLVNEIKDAGGTAIAVGADLTDADSVKAMIDTIRDEFGGLDILVLNASGGMESNMGEDYALRLNRDAQVGMLQAAREILSENSRVVFVTSHQAHFIKTTPTMPEYEPVARSKRAGEDALLELVPELKANAIDFVVVSGDMIEGTITATLLNRLSPGAIEQRREQAGKLYNVAEFAAEVAKATVEPIPADNIRLVGDVSSFNVA